MKTKPKRSFSGYRVDRYFKRLEIFTFSTSSLRLISRTVVTPNKCLTTQERFKVICEECRELGLKEPDFPEPSDD